MMKGQVDLHIMWSMESGSVYEDVIDYLSEVNEK